MSFSELPALRSPRRVPTHAHVWVALPGYPGWVQCEQCGVTARCKACAAHQVGVAGVAYLPTVVCPAHAPQATFLASLEVQQADIARWLLTLAGTVPEEAWQRNGVPLSQARECAQVVVDGLVLRFAHAVTQDAWGLTVAVRDGVSERTVFVADGPSTALQVLTYQPGEWVSNLMTVLSLHDALPQAA